MIEWVWTVEKPYPETLETLVRVKHRDGEISDECTVDFWRNSFVSVEDIGDEAFSSWYPTGMFDDIVAYEVVK